MHDMSDILTRPKCSFHVSCVILLSSQSGPEVRYSESDKKIASEQPDVAVVN